MFTYCACLAKCYSAFNQEINLLKGSLEGLVIMIIADCGLTMVPRTCVGGAGSIWPGQSTASTPAASSVAR